VAQPDEFDVVVVGAGGIGLAAACSAAQQGARVLLLEKAQEPGGTTGIAVGSFTAAGTTIQRAAGYEDSPEQHAGDVAKFAAPSIEAHNNGPLRDYFLRHAAETIEWLRSMGMIFLGPSPEPPNRLPRMHNVVPNAKAYIARLSETFAQYEGCSLLCQAQVTQLLRDRDRVSGVVAQVRAVSETFRAARGVILAGGDYASNADLIAKYKGHRYRPIEGINPHADGSGHLLAESAGARLVNMEITYGPELRFVPQVHKPLEQRLPATGPLARLISVAASKLPDFLMRLIAKRLVVTWQHPEDSLFADGAILLNGEGKRFVNENQSPDRELAVAAQPDKLAYILLDARLAERYGEWPHFISTAPDIAYAYVRDYQRLRPDITRTGLNPADVARRGGLPGAQVQETVAAFNRYVEGEVPDAFGRSGDQHPLASGPFVLLGPLKAYFTTTEGGAAINEDLQVLDDHGRIIPGLYAVGQNGLGGMVLWGHGLHIAWAMTSGRLAGRKIMEQGS